MDWVINLKDKSGRMIHLSKERWKHMTTLHPGIANRLESIKATLINPSLVVSHKFDESMRNYYTFDKHKNRYLLVSVKYLNGDGFIATAFFTKKAKRR